MSSTTVVILNDIKGAFDKGLPLYKIVNKWNFFPFLINIVAANYFKHRGIYLSINDETSHTQKKKAKCSSRLLLGPLSWTVLYSKSKTNKQEKKNEKIVI